MLLFCSGDDMKDLFEHVGAVADTDTFDNAVTKLRTGLQGRTNNVMQRNLFLANYPQGTKSFECWSKKVSNAAKLINYENYDWKQVAVCAILLQTSNPKLQERALQGNVSYEDLLILGITKEQSEKRAALLEKASGQSGSQEQHYAQEVRQLQYENRRLKAHLSQKACGHCGFDKCEQRQKCPAMGQKSSNCHKMKHYAKACRSRPHKKSSLFGRLSSADESYSEESSGRIVVRRLKSHSISAKIYIDSPTPSNNP